MAAASTASRSSGSSLQATARPAVLVQVGGRIRRGSPGFALFIVVYYSHATSFLIDTSVADLMTAAWEAIALSRRRDRARLVRLRRALPRLRARRGAARDPSSSRSSARPRLGPPAWNLFAPRAAYMQVGAMIGTMMVGNVFFVIIPAHWELIRAKEAGTRARPALEHPRQDSLRAQQATSRAAGERRDALEPLHLHVRALGTAGSRWASR